MNIKQLLLQTSKANISNSVKSSHTFSNINIHNLIGMKKNAKLTLKQVKGIQENDNDWINEISSVDLPKNTTFNIYLICNQLSFQTLIRNEALLTTYQLSLPKKTQYTLNYRLNSNIVRFYWYDTADGLTLYNYLLNNPTKDLNYRFKIVSGLSATYNGKTGTFAGISKTAGQTNWWWFGTAFDDGTSPINSLTNINNVIVEILEFYTFSEDFNRIDDKFNQEIVVENYSNSNVTLSLEYRDLETNSIITNTNNEAYPDLNFLFDVEVQT
jgi:hypothetical protein